MSDTKTLREAAQAVVDRWDSPRWKDLQHTGEYINALRAALAAQAQAEPLFLLYTGAIDSGGEQDDWDTQANSGKAVEAFCREHPGQTVGLYPFAAPVPAQTQAEPVAAQSRFQSEPTWRECSVEHARMVLADPQEWPGYEVRLLSVYTAAQQPAQTQDEPAPVLVRDLAEIIGSNVQTVCRALVAMGRPPRSTNMAVSGEEALAVAVHLKASQQADLVDCRDLLMRSGMALEVVSGEWRESDPTLRVDLARATATHNAAPQPAQAQAEPVAHHIERCDDDVFKRGESVCMLAVPKEHAEAGVRIASALTGDKYDWHYVGGRVHVKRLAAKPAQPEHQPLTAEEVQEMRQRGFDLEDEPEAWAYERGVRDAERAHGIGAKGGE